LPRFADGFGHINFNTVGKSHVLAPEVLQRRSFFHSAKRRFILADRLGWERLIQDKSPPCVSPVNNMQGSVRNYLMDRQRFDPAHWAIRPGCYGTPVKFSSKRFLWSGHLA
jgi:hypothetical protein